VTSSGAKRPILPNIGLPKFTPSKQTQVINVYQTHLGIFNDYLKELYNGSLAAIMH